MKRFLKWGLIVVLAIVVILGGIALYINIAGVPSYDTRTINLHVERTPARIERGRYLATQLCAMCHLNPRTKVLSGTEMLDMPPEFGRAWSKNITQHPTKGIGKWTDGELAWLLRTGIHPKTGKYVPPWMVKLPHMADEDLYSIIAWLRSDDPMLAASDADNREPEPTFLAKLLCYVAFKPFDYPSKPIPLPDTANTVAYGKYLTTAVFDCYGCHLADFANMNAADPESSKGYLAGGMQMPDAAKHTSVSANLTPDKQTGIGSWTRDEFITVLKTGIRRDGTPLRYPMTRLQKFSDHALGSIYDYLQTVPAVNNKITRTLPNGPWKSEGERLFDVYACSSCHGKDGVGFASLKLADAKYPDDSVLIDVIKDQVRYNPDGFMPRYDGVLDDGKLTMLAQHVRGLCRSGSK